jgi:hypothetical protein
MWVCGHVPANSVYSNDNVCIYFPIVIDNVKESWQISFGTDLNFFILKTSFILICLMALKSLRKVVDRSWLYLGAER